METRNISLTLEKAKEWYNSGNEALKEAALQAFTKDELKDFDFRKVKTFFDALKVLYPADIIVQINKTISNLGKVSKASVAMFKLNIIRKALNKGHKMSFTEGKFWYPYTPLLLPESRYSKDINEIELGIVKIDDKYFTLISGGTSYYDYTGLGLFNYSSGVAFSSHGVAFLGCATKEIAQHLGIYFAKEIFEAKYGDLINYEWIDE